MTWATTRRIAAPLLLGVIVLVVWELAVQLGDLGITEFVNQKLVRTLPEPSAGGAAG